MPQEIEVKLKVEEHAPVRAALVRLNARRVGVVRETNIFFDRPDGSLRRRETGLRVRFSAAAGEAVPATLLTVKGPANAAGLRAREAFDLTLTPHDQIVPLLKLLGFEQQLLFEKDRESWKWEECSVELDTMPELGTFVEIEGPSEEAVLAGQAALGLGHLLPHRPSYSRMVAELVAQRPEEMRELRFAGGDTRK